MEYTLLKIFFADDDSDDLELIQEGLLQVAPSHTLHYVDHGEKVLPAVKEFMPHIIILDYNMPGCDGSECLKMIKADPDIRNIPIVIYTTSSADYSVNQFYKLGAARYLLKPVNYSGIFKGLEVILKLYKNKELVRPDFPEFVIDTYKMQ